ncbi:hypothetical protein N7532_000257 [Penicillium argentinense]|uniref:F-box domain-containing protein n=1 Tax=Penicillium argentinense TaxID=1131581 RepID=A0A9W9G569_9EURO|nr:uncharacterized protein N7532_000257 [Penicillium argentinense]KAJ5112212.1 hypothetical protein N7532_000257 [Penicillium argentinense]
MNGAGLLDLPHEILLEIASNILRTSDLSHFLCASRTLHDVLSLEPYKREVANTGGEAITILAQQGHEAGVRYMLDEGVKVDKRGAKFPHTTALGEAVASHNLGIARLLLDHGAGMNKVDSLVTPALTLAIYPEISREDTSMMELLLDYKADMNMGNLGNRTLVPLIVAVRCRNQTKMEFLLSKGADPNICVPQTQQTALHIAIMKKMPIQTLEVLLNAGAKVNCLDNEGRSPLHMADFCAPINLDNASTLTGSGAKVNLPTSMPIIQETVGFENLRCADILLQHGADIQARDNRGWSVLHYQADKLCDAFFFKWYCDQGCDVNWEDENKETPIFKAIASKRNARLKPVTVKTILSLGASVNLVNSQGQSPLGLAVTQACPEVTRVLLEHGADIHHRDGEGKTLLQMAVRNRYWVRDVSNNYDPRRVVKLLLQYGADLTEVVPAGRTPLSVGSLWDLDDIIDSPQTAHETAPV